MFRKQMALDMGFVIPSVRIKDSGQLNPNQYSILLKGEEVARGHTHGPLSGPASRHGCRRLPGIDTIDPAFHIPAKWISGDKEDTGRAGRLYPDRPHFGGNHPPVRGGKGAFP